MTVLTRILKSYYLIISEVDAENKRDTVTKSVKSEMKDIGIILSHLKPSSRPDEEIEEIEAEIVRTKNKRIAAGESETAPSTVPADHRMDVEDDSPTRSNADRSSHHLYVWLLLRKWALLASWNANLAQS